MTLATETTSGQHLPGFQKNLGKVLADFYFNHVKQIGIILASLVLAVCTAQAAHTQARLLLAADNARPGDTVLAGIELKMDEGWHTYWKNPGEAGQATEIKWQLPPGVTAGAIQWPLPEKLPPAEVTTYGYQNEVVLIVPLTFATNLPAGALDLSAKVSWLECKESCIPASSPVQAKLTLGSQTKPSADAALIQSWQSRTPQTMEVLFQPGAWWQTPAAGKQRTLAIELDWLKPNTSIPPEHVDFFPAASDDYEVQSASEVILNSPGELQFGKVVKKFSGDWPTQISGVIVIENNNARQGFEISLPIHDQAAIAPAPAAATVAAATDLVPPAPPSLGKMLLFAFIGGLILNIMPCVLPVIALKILGFVSEAKSEPGHVRVLGAVYALGVMVSFLALAGVVIAVKLAGHQAAWGMQFGNPIFLVSLITLLLLVALNLFGLFEVNLTGGAMNVASDLSLKSGKSGAFFNGVLATVLATPCTAPILGSALGFAFTQSAGTLTVIFLFIGLGLASPYLLLSWNPAWLKFLPKPGVWMEKFKVAMGFPMLAAVLWLFNVAGSTYGKNVLWLGLFLIVLAAAAWTYGEFVQRGRRRQSLAAAICVVLLFGGYAYALERELNWRHPVIEIKSAASLQESAEGIAWQSWSPAAVAQARATGRPVLVDFTADWCLTCQVNKKTSIEIPSVREKIKALNAIALLADYTRTPDVITTELARFNRAGVPLVLVYPKDPAAPPQVLPEVLTPGIVLEALDRAAK